MWTLVLLGLWYYCLGDWIFSALPNLDFDAEPNILLLNISEPFPPVSCARQNICSPTTLDYLEELVQEFVSRKSNKVVDEIYLNAHNEYFVAVWNDESVIHLSAQDKRHNVRWYFGKRWTKAQLRTVPRKSSEDEVYRIKFSLKHILQALKTIPVDNEHQ